MAVLPEPGTHTCGCPSTNDTLPKLVSFFQGYGSNKILYSDNPISPFRFIPKNLGIESVCSSCQLKTQAGVEEAISAIHSGPDIFVDHNVLSEMFFSLIELRLQQEGPVAPEMHKSQEGPYESLAFNPTNGRSTLDTPPSTPKSTKWNWEHIWHDFVKAFELRRDRANVAELLRDLAKLSMLKHESWWIALVQKLGAEAFLSLELYISKGSVPEMSSIELSALKRDVTLIQSVDDLFDVYVEIDSRMHGFVYAYDTLRIRKSEFQ
ncbi:hypothetical protein F5Y10DRAFT_288068 [Nemania abortiva]|nr:hypothetical protein F5Y10DRAFT_288068 [Nemania abortiva]